MCLLLWKQVISCQWLFHSEHCLKDSYVWRIGIRCVFVGKRHGVVGVTFVLLMKFSIAVV